MSEMIEAQSNELLEEGYAQLIIADTGWTDEEREAMRQRGFDGMDMLMVWFN